jgi:predicted GNAT family acetyltransferase
VVIRGLLDADAGAMHAFLAPRTATSMFLLSNSLAAGFVDRGERLQATYVGAFAAGALVGVVAHCWNGMLLVQAPAELVAPDVVHELARAAVASSGRAVTGCSGQADQVAVLRAAFALPAPAIDVVQQLYTLALADVRIPDALARGEVRCRRPTPGERAQVVAWRRAYHLETLAATEDDELGARVEGEIAGALARDQLWVLERDGGIVAMTTFNAHIPGTAQVGGVYTPPEQRNRGYARSVVAGSLLDARGQGDEQAILFTPDPAAARAYEAIGFQRSGEYGLVVL